MKRTRYEEEAGPEEIIDSNMAKALILLSEANKLEQSNGIIRNKEDEDHRYNRMFGCKTCSRKFSSFQALGGHSASHKKPKLSSDGNSQASMVSNKTKKHGCSICGMEFSVGQALGGHMRKHKDAPYNVGYLVEDKNDISVGKKVMLFGFVLATIG